MDKRIWLKEFGTNNLLDTLLEILAVDVADKGIFACDTNKPEIAIIVTERTVAYKINGADQIYNVAEMATIYCKARNLDVNDSIYHVLNSLIDSIEQIVRSNLYWIFPLRT
jgi:hypothetical protein